MSKYCPVVKRKVVYLDCLECDDKQCLKPTANTESTNTKNTSLLSQEKESPENGVKSPTEAKNID